MRAHHLWRCDTPTMWEATGESAERFLAIKIAAHMRDAHPRAADRDAHLHRRLTLLRWTDFHHLELPTPSPRAAPAWRLAAALLRSMGGVDAPADKLTAIMNTCRVLSTALAAAQDDCEGGVKGGAIGADDFLPALIYTVIKAAPRRLYSDLRCIAELRAESKLLSEEGYFYTNLQSAVRFARCAGAREMNVTDEEFRERRAQVAAEDERSKGDGGMASDSVIAADDSRMLARLNQYILEASSSASALTLITTQSTATTTTKQTPPSAAAAATSTVSFFKYHELPTRVALARAADGIEKKVTNAMRGGGDFLICDAPQVAGLVAALKAWETALAQIEFYANNNADGANADAAVQAEAKAMAKAKAKAKAKAEAEPSQKPCNVIIGVQRP